MMAGGPEQTGRSTWFRPALGETIVAVGVLVLAVVVWWQTTLIPVTPIYARVGPTIIPYMTALALGVLGILLLVEALRGGWQTGEEKETVPDRAALLWIGAGLILNVLLIGYVGFTLASIILFVCVARGFGSKAILRDAGIGAAFALTAYLGFAKTLGINIGSGLVENALENLLSLVTGG